MTERKRSKGSNMFVWGVMGFLVLGMGGFGLSGAFLNTGGSAVATVGDEEVSVDLYYQALRQDVAQASQNFGFQLNLSQAQTFGLDQVTLRRLLTIAAIDNETGNLNLSVGDDAVRSDLITNPAFRGLTGEFDTVAYDFALQQIGMTRDEYDIVIRNALAQEILRDGIMNIGHLDLTAKNTIMGYVGEQRGFDWVFIDGAALTETAPAPSQSDLITFYEANPELFTRPETRDITYVALTPEMLMSDVDVAEADIQEEFEARSALYNTPASIIVDRIAFGTIEDAQTAADQIDADASSFDIVAAARGLNPAEISLGSVTANQVSPDAREILFSATEPGVYGPVSSNVGPALFRINAVRPAKSTPLEDVREEIRDAIALNQAGNMIVSAFDDIDDLVAGGASLEDIAAETDMQLFTLNFAIENVEGLTAQEVFITEALDAELNEERDILESEDGGIFALRVDALNDSFVSPLNEKRDVAIEGRLAEHTQELVFEFAEKLQSLIEIGADFSATMSANGLSPEKAVGITRNAPSDVVSPAVNQGVFELDLAGLAVFEEDGGVFLVRLASIEPFDPENENSAAAAIQIEQQITDTIESDIFNYYSNAVMSDAGFTVNQPLIDAIISQNSGQ